MECIKLEYAFANNTECSKAVSAKIEPLVFESLSHIILQTALVHKKSCVITNYPPRPHETL